VPLTIYNTLTRRPDPVTPADPSRVTFYTCGPTVYDDAHIGNFRSFLAADLLRRWLESPLCELTNADGSTHRGPRTVVHVMNITDVGHMTDDDVADGAGEDKMQLAARRLLEAKKSGTAHVDIADPNDPRQIAAFYTQRFLEDARKLGLKVALDAEADPSVMPRASDNIDGMKRMIETLAAKGFAYRVGDAVYFDVQECDRRAVHYGELSGNTLEKLRGGAGGRVQDEHQAGKRHPADFLLWKSDSTHLMKWPGPVIDGAPMPEGYPGWHIECSVMAIDRLVANSDRGPRAEGPGPSLIDIHSGGEDNIFPHHECERAQSCGATGADSFARHWFHPRFLLYDGEKMSKSKGTFFTARDLFAKGIEPAALRLELIKTHYRANANFTEQGLKDSQRRIERWRRARYEIARRSMGWDTKKTDPRRAGHLMAIDFATSMNNDLNVSEAIGCIEARLSGYLNEPFDLESEISDSEIDEFWAERGDASAYSAPIDVFRFVEPVLGVLSLERAVAAETSIGIFVGIDPDPDVVALLKQRRDARAAKDFAAADAIRDKLTAMGYAIKDAPDGRVEVSLV